MSRPGIRLADYFDLENVRLDLAATTKPEAIRELLASFGLPPESEAATLRTILRREEMGSTGIGRGIAVPHGRTPLVSTLRVAFGRSVGGIPYESVDAAPVHYLFLLLAPPVEVSNEYLPVLGRIAELAKDPATGGELAAVESVEDLLALFQEGD